MFGDRKYGVKEINNRIKRIDTGGNEVFGKSKIVGITTSFFAVGTACENPYRIQTKINYSLFHKRPKTAYQDCTFTLMRLFIHKDKYICKRPVKSTQGVTGIRQ
jgi:hypothetical protein